MDLNAPLLATVVTVTGSTTLDARWAGQMLVVNSANAATVTIPAGLPRGYAITIMQGGAGVITVAAASGVSLYNINNQFRSAGQRTVLGLISAIAADDWSLSGQTVA